MVLLLWLELRYGLPDEALAMATQGFYDEAQHSDLLGNAHVDWKRNETM